MPGSLTTTILYLLTFFSATHNNLGVFCLVLGSSHGASRHKHGLGLLSSIKPPIQKRSILKAAATSVGSGDGQKPKAPVQYIRGGGMPSSDVRIWPTFDALDQRLTKIALPCILNFAIAPLVGAVDLFWVNRMGNPLAVAGQAAANQVFSSAFWLASFLPSGELW
jgi:hypothetical protein